MAKPPEINATEWAWGKQAVRELVRIHPEWVLRIFMAPAERDSLAREIAELGARAGIPITFLERKALDRKFAIPAHQAVVARLRPVTPYLPLETLVSQIQMDRLPPPVLLAADHLTDPQNLGAMIRTAHCAGVQGLILPKDRACPITGTVRKAATGAVEHLALVQVVNLAQTIETLKKAGFWVLSTEAQAPTSLYDLDLNLPLVIVVGGESRGVSALIRKKSDWTASIPMRGTITSLNASAACAVVLFEVLRQKIQKTR